MLRLVLEEVHMDIYSNNHYTGERALFRLQNAVVKDCLFDDGESPLKEARNLKVENVTFGWKYPLWYGRHHEVRNCTFLEMSRSGIWYTHNSKFYDCHIIAPKEFRRCNNIYLENIIFDDAKETLWNCSNVEMKNVKAKGDYLAMNVQGLKVDHLELDGNYFADGASDIEVTNSVLNSKDAFWNCKNVTVRDSVINGEYFGWNSENVTLINCTISSHQGFCYMKNLTLINCTIKDSDLTFEYCENINAQINSSLSSVKNPISGEIRCEGVKEMIRDDERIDLTKIHVLVKKGDGYEQI